MKKFTMGVIAGMSSLAVAVPLFAQMGIAATGDSTPAADRPVPSQACIQELAKKDALVLSTMDAMTAAHKGAMQAHHSGLVTAAAIADEAARATALEEAHTAFRTAMKAAMEANAPDQEQHQAQMEALKAACGDSIGMRGMHGMRMFKHHKGGMAGALGFGPGHFFRKSAPVPASAGETEALPVQ